MTERRVLDIVRARRPPAPGSEAAVTEACRRGRERRVGVMPAPDGGERPLGRPTGRDAVRPLAEGRTGGERLHAATARAPEAMPPGRSATGAPRPTRDGASRHTPVVDRGRRGHVIGIVPRGDVRGTEHDRLDAETGLWERTSAMARPPREAAPKYRMGGLLGVALLFAASGAAAQQTGDPALGRELAERWCSGCHHVGPGAATPAADAVPGFASIAAAPSTTPPSLQAFLRHPHGAMPDLRLTEAQIRDIGAYILGLRGR